MSDTNRNAKIGEQNDDNSENQVKDFLLEYFSNKDNKKQQEETVKQTNSGEVEDNLTGSDCTKFSDKENFGNEGGIYFKSSTNLQIPTTGPHDISQTIQNNSNSNISPFNSCNFIPSYGININQNMSNIPNMQGSQNMSMGAPMMNQNMQGMNMNLTQMPNNYQINMIPFNQMITSQNNQGQNSNNQNNTSSQGNNNSSTEIPTLNRNNSAPSKSNNSNPSNSCNNAYNLNNNINGANTTINTNMMNSQGVQGMPNMNMMQMQMFQGMPNMMNFPQGMHGIQGMQGMQCMPNMMNFPQGMPNMIQMSNNLSKSNSNPNKNTAQISPNFNYNMYNNNFSNLNRIRANFPNMNMCNNMPAMQNHFNSMIAMNMNGMNNMNPMNGMRNFHQVQSANPVNKTPSNSNLSIPNLDGSQQITNQFNVDHDISPSINKSSSSLLQNATSNHSTDSIPSLGEGIKRSIADYSAKPKILLLDKKYFQQNSQTDITDTTEDSESLEEVMKNLKGQLHEFICTQQGSRIFQKILNKISPESLDSILFKLSGFFKELMTDVYGNYFSQKLFQCCTSEQRVYIFKNIISDFVYIACHNSGTHSIQSLVELVNMPDEEIIVKESITDNIMQLSFDANGTHVMQKILSAIKEENREEINFIILENLDRLVLDNNGVCVIKKFITRNKDENIKKKINEILLKNCLEILQNPFGNYIIQHVLASWPLESCQSILKVILDNVGSLSMQKFSSNVVEKCLGIVDPDFRKRIIKELFNVTKIASLIKNKFGMFVLQKAIETMRCEEKLEIKEYLIKKLSVTSKQEKGRLNALIDLISTKDTDLL